MCPQVIVAQPQAQCFGDAYDKGRKRAAVNEPESCPSVRPSKARSLGNDAPTQRHPRDTCDEEVSPSSSDAGDSIEQAHFSGSPTAETQDAHSETEDVRRHWQAREGQMYPSLPEVWALQDEVTPKMRFVVLAWLLDLCREYKMARETFFLTINYIDRFLARKRLAIENLKLAAISCLWIAGKYEEVHPPSANMLLYILKNVFSVEELCKMEVEVLTALDFELGAPTPFKFLECFAREGGFNSVSVYSSAVYMLESAMLTIPIAACTLHPGTLSTSTPPLSPSQGGSPSGNSASEVSNISEKSPLGRQLSPSPICSKPATAPHISPVSTLSPSPSTLSTSSILCCDNSSELSGIETDACEPEPGPEACSSIRNSTTIAGTGTVPGAAQLGLDPIPPCLASGCGYHAPSHIAAASLMSALMMHRCASRSSLEALARMSDCKPKHLLLLAEFIWRKLAAAQALP